MTIKNIYNMKDNQTFIIKYTKLDGEEVVRNGKFIMAHYKWIKSVLDQMKEIKIGLKGYRYLDEALELSSELGLNIDEAEIIRTNSTGLTIYNPKNLADRIKAMKNKEKTREQKIAERLAYNQQNQAVN